MKELTRITKTYMCACGAQNKFELDTDLGIDGLQAKAKCQNCGNEVMITLGNGINGMSNMPLAPSAPASSPSPTIDGSIFDLPITSAVTALSDASTEPTTNDQTSIPNQLQQSSASQPDPYSNTPNPMAPAVPEFSSMIDLSVLSTGEPTVSSMAENTNSIPGSIQSESIQSESIPSGAMSSGSTAPAKRAKSALEAYAEREEDVLSNEEYVNESPATPEEEQALRDLFGRI